MVSGTVARVPVVSTTDVVNIDFAGNGGYCTINGSAASLPHTATSEEVSQGYVEIGVSGSGNSMYINSITATLAYLPPVGHATWDFTNSSATALAVLALSETKIDQAITINGIEMIVNANGKRMGNNTNSIWTYPGVTFKIPVISTEDVVTVNGYPGYCEYTINGGATITDETTNYTATAADVDRGYVIVVNGVTDYKYICSIAVKQKAQTSVIIGSTGWATFSNTFATDFTNLVGVVDAYQVTGNSGSAITKSAVTGTAAANTGLLLNAAAGTYAIPLTATGTDLSGTNKLKAVASSTAVGAAPDGYTNFVLVGGGGTASFKKITGTNSATVGAGKAYLQLAGTSFEANLFFMDDDVTAINAVKSNAVENGMYYNLAGQRVENPTKGLYIVNGKKVIIK